MSTVLDRDALESSPLADLHVIANELGVDGFRRLRKADLVDAILTRQSGEAPAADTELEADVEAEAEAEVEVDAVTAEETEAPPKPRRTRGRARSADPEVETEEEAEADEAEEGATDEDAPARSRRGRRGGRGRGRRGEEDGDGERDRDRDRDRGRGRDRDREVDEDRVAEGAVELLGNGSAFIRLGAEGETTDDDVYVSAAQVKRCELVTGDRIAGPVRAPRRSLRPKRRR